MEIEAAAVKVAKWATSESGDTLEMIERPHGGISFALADGQSSGRAARAISNIVARKVIAELAEGVRDGAAARAANDYLYTYRAGKVSATLNILSADLVSNTLVLSRNSHCPILILTPDGQLQVLDGPSEPIGVRRGVRPEITELPLEAGMTVVAYTDGLQEAGGWSSRSFDVPTALTELAAQITSGEANSAHVLANALMVRALALEQGRARDDISVLVLRVIDRESDGVRHLLLRLPF